MSCLMFFFKQKTAYELRSSDWSSDVCSSDLGALLARHEVRAELDGTHVDYAINGVYLGAGDQHHDITTFIDQARPHGGSHEMVKGVLTGRARGVFKGKHLARKRAVQGKRASVC